MQLGWLGSLSQLAIIHLLLGDLAAIAQARGDTAAAAEWARQRDAKVVEVERLARGH